MHPDDETMDTHLRHIRDYALPPSVNPLVIKKPTIQANNFELKSITLLKAYQILENIALNNC